MPIDVLFDMETSDPDDVLTLSFLATHPKVNLRAVTVTPGSEEQIGVVRHVLARLGKTIQVGGGGESKPKSVSAFHYRWLGTVPTSKPDAPGPEVLRQAIADHPHSVLLTGAALHNPGHLFRMYPDVRLETWVGQGGYAGDSIVAPENRLKKFEGKETCPTFNFNGAPVLAQEMLDSPRIGNRWLVSKNVCHGVVYDQAMHARVGALPCLTEGMRLLYEGMGVYLEHRPDGKAFHDPLAATALIDPSVCEFREVECYRERGMWGSRLAKGTRTKISVAVDRERFFDTITET